MRRLSVLFVLAATLAVSAGEKPAVRWEPVPYFGHGSPGRKIDLIVIHTVEGSAASCLATFRTSPRHVSAHYLVAKDGTIYQCVKDEDVAWHAGSVNGHSIGIEHEGFARRRDTWTDANYAASARLTRWLCDTYGVPIDRQHIMGHVELKNSDHDDPGPYFDWDLYMRLVRGEVATPTSSTLASSDEGLPPPSPRTPAQASAPPQRAAAPQQAVAATTSASAPTQGILGALGREPSPAQGRAPSEPRLLARGSQGEDVRALQHAINEAAQACVLDEDGLYGPETEKAVRAFQAEHGCKVDGIVGPETRAALAKK